MSDSSATSYVFRPPAERWVSVSPKMAAARRVTLTFVLVAFLIGVGVLAALKIPRWIPGVALIAVVVIGGWLWWLIGRRVRSFGYAERADDLLVTSGIMNRRLVIVPYGRMQLVDVVSGPIDRLFGVSTVQLHTAAATTDATIPGLLPADAAALRDRLAERGEERTAGL